MANVNIAVTVQDNQTMSQYAMTKSGKVSFFNAGDGPLLVVTPKSGTPFCRHDGMTVVPRIEVPKGESRKVSICDLYGQGQFLYTAQIGTALPEDPIVILERSLKFNKEMVIDVGIGIVLGVAATYAFLRYRPSRPQSR